MKWEKRLVWSICAVLLVAAGIWYTAHKGVKPQVDSFTAETAADTTGETNTNSPKVSADARQNSSGEIAVYICGAVSHPGVYRFFEAVRVCDVVDAAGGLTKRADSSAVNQARFVQDGEQIQIPIRQKNASAKQTGAPAVQDSTHSSDGAININIATREELMKLPGIGASKADAIIAYRAENGSFQSPEDIMKISGIKDGVYQKIKDKITI